MCLQTDSLKLLLCVIMPVFLIINFVIDADLWSSKPDFCPDTDHTDPKICWSIFSSNVVDYVLTVVNLRSVRCSVQTFRCLLTEPVSSWLRREKSCTRCAWSSSGKSWVAAWRPQPGRQKTPRRSLLLFQRWWLTLYFKKQEMIFTKNYSILTLSPPEKWTSVASAISENVGKLPFLRGWEYHTRWAFMWTPFKGSSTCSCLYLLMTLGVKSLDHSLNTF